MQSERKDSIRNSQRRWLASALKVGLSVDSFLIVEWTTSAETCADVEALSSR
jgi:hypothetical protein